MWYVMNALFGKTTRIASVRRFQMKSANKKKDENFAEIVLDPEKHGLTQCPHCNGYGSSLKDPDGVATCTVCHGSGLIRKLSVPKRK
jgi:hypothetical protein